MRNLVRAMVLVCALCACSTRTARPPQPPPRGVPTPPTLTFSSSAAAYNEPSEPVPSTALGDLILQHVQAAATSAGRQPPIADEHLFLASHALASVTPEEGVVPYGFVEFALHASGVIEPSPHILVVWGQLMGARGPLAQAFRPALDAIFRDSDVARVGVGAVIRDRTGYGAVVLTLLSSRIRTTPIARTIPVDSAIELDFWVPDGWVSRAELMQPDGVVKELALRRREDGGFAATIACGTKGKLSLSIDGSGGTDVETLAKFPIWCGELPPATFTIAPPAGEVPADPLDAERQLYERVNAERKRAGRSPVRWDHGLAATAREHSRAMRAAKLVAHRVPGQQTALEQRVRATRLDISVAGLIGRSYGLEETHRGFFELPSTRKSLMSEDATEIGIGIDYGPEVYRGVRELYITEVVARPLR